MEWVFAGLAGLLVVYEIIALVNRRDGDTISEIHWRMAKERPLVPFLWGLLMGHFFW